MKNLLRHFNKNSSMSSTAFSLLSLSIAYVLQMVDYTALESTGLYLLKPLVSGIGTVTFASLSALCVVTKPSKDAAVLSSAVFITCAFWAAIGMSDISKEFTPRLSQNISEETFNQMKVLLPGHIVLVVLFAIFSFLLLLFNHQKDLVVFMSLSLLSSACFITNMLTDIKGRSITLLSLAFISSYISAKTFFHSFTKNKSKLEELDFQNKRVIRYALNALSLSPWILNSFAVTESSTTGFVWPLSSGLFLLLHGVSGLRWGNITISTCSIMDGLFWTSVGGSMYVELLKQYSDIFSAAVSVPISLIFLSFAVVFVQTEILLSFQYLLLSVLILTLTFDNSAKIAVSTFAWLCFILNVYGYVSFLCKSFSFKINFPVGQNGWEKIRSKIFAKKTFMTNRIGVDNVSKNLFETNTMLGFSKYAESESLGYLANVIIVLAFIWVPQEISFLSLPWIITYGCCFQFVIGFICFSRGQTFESSSFLIFASFWSIWGGLRSLGLFRTDLGMSLGVGVCSFLLIGLLFAGISLTVNKIWTSIFVFFDLMMIATLLQVLGINDGYMPERIFGTALSISFLYAFLASVIKMTYGKEIIPFGRPLQEINKIQKYKDQMLWAPARRASGVREIAEKLKTGCICGIPSDTVYILVACCNQPEAVKRAYKTKKQAEDRPMSLWISNFQQIEAAKHDFSSLLWDFLHEIWPSNVSAVLKRGDWVKSLGLGESEKYLGRPDSIAMRIPDSTITCHLIDQCGPVAVTSANPTGEGDTTHHVQVLAKLGLQNCDGILCDGPSRENAISTVVDCRDIDNGNLAFFRIGLTPKSTILNIFETLLKKHGKMPKSDTNGIIQVNGAYEKEINE